MCSQQLKQEAGRGEEVFKNRQNFLRRSSESRWEVLNICMMAQRQTVTAEQLAGDRTGIKCEPDDGGGKVEGEMERLRCLT